MSKNNTTKSGKKTAVPTRRELGIYGKYLTWIANAPLKPGPKSVLLALTDYISNKNPKRVWPGQDKIAKKARLTSRQVRTNLKKLQRLGYITIEKRERKEGYKQPHLYILKLGYTHDPADEKVSKASGGNEGNRKKVTKNLSKTSYECNKGMEPSLEMNVESQDDCQPPSESRRNDSVLNINSNTEEKNIKDQKYIWTSKDTAAARALVWYDFYHPQVGGREIVTDHGSSIPLLIENTEIHLCQMASQLSSEYAEAALDSPRARVAFWHLCGRLFFPDAPKFVDTHVLPNEQSQLLHRIFDYLGGKACYVVAHAMAAWKRDHKEFGNKTNPDIYIIWENIDLLESEWHAEMKNVEFPLEKWIYELLADRFYAHRREDVMDFYYEALMSKSA